MQVIGGGHNGLVCAAYLARAGCDVTLFERRELLGGACVTEELWPGYRSSRAAYVLSLFRPQISRELGLPERGLRLLPRRPSSFTPLPDGRSLVLGTGPAEDRAEIARFSERDARAWPRYEAWLERVADALEPTLDAPPPEGLPRGAREWAGLWRGARAAFALGRDLPRAARLLLAPARDLLEEHFDSEPLRSTLATDAVIGAFAAPSSPGTGYVLFHHVMGSISGRRGVWAYVRGGMGALSDAIADAARAAGATLRTDAEVVRIRTRDGRARGVTLASGESPDADTVVCGLDLHHGLALLDGESPLEPEALRAAGTIDYRSPVVKLNLALDRLPAFATRDRDDAAAVAGGTIHIGPTDLDGIERAFDDAKGGRVSELPVVELTIPSLLDDSLAPPGHHVASVFAQYAPIRPLDDPEWPTLREQMRERVFDAIERVAPRFRDSVLHCEVLAAPDLERIYGLRGGNIFHGAMTPDRLLSMRPLVGWARYRTPLAGLYLCGSAAHPGGGVMGAPGRNAAATVLRDLSRPRRRAS